MRSADNHLRWFLPPTVITVLKTGPSAQRHFLANEPSSFAFGIRSLKGLGILIDGPHTLAGVTFGSMIKLEPHKMFM